MMVVAAVLAIVVVAAATYPTLARSSPRAVQAGVPARILYIAGSHLWVRSVDSGPARRVSTPWPMTRAGGVVADVKWSPDGRRVAVDDGRGRLGMVNLITGRLTVLVGRGCASDCSLPAYAWSPNSRYLAFLQSPTSGQRAVLKSWDSVSGRIRVLMSDVSAYVAYPEWSHDSTRIAVPTGTFDTIKNVYPNLVTVALHGRMVQLGKGTDARWSPDDRLVGIIRPNTCGANTCDEDVVVEPAGGGTAVVLKRHSSSLFDNPIWSPQTRPYTFDRWQLGPYGHPERRLAGAHQIVLSWRSDGTRLALQTYYPYQSTPDSLYITTPSGTSTRLATDGRNQGCGACSKDVYTVTWSRTQLVAWTTPTYPTPNNVTIPSRVFVSSLNGATPVRVPLPGASLVTILGFADHDHVLVLQADKVIYAYHKSTGSVSTLVRGVSNPYATAFLDPTIPSHDAP